MTPVSTPVLPPDPGEAGKATLEGIDSDGDGLRDDLQRYIALTYPDDPQLQRILREQAVSYQAALLEGDDVDAALQNSADLRRTIRCTFDHFGDDLEIDISGLLTRLEAEIVNTEARLDAWLSHNDRLGGHVLVRCNGDECATECDFLKQ